jgi:hypothetical protein
MMGHPIVFGGLREQQQQQQRQRQKWASMFGGSPPIARSGGLRMGHPSVSGWLRRTGNDNRRSFDCGGKSAAFAQDDNFVGV